MIITTQCFLIDDDDYNTVSMTTANRWTEDTWLNNSWREHKKLSITACIYNTLKQHCKLSVYL